MTPGTGSRRGWETVGVTAQNKRLVLCCDGTWNRSDQCSSGKPCPTNVMKLAVRVKKFDPESNMSQVVYYGDANRQRTLGDYLGGDAFTRTLDQNVEDAYRFLVANYDQGDHIFLFGFSRGAYVARTVAEILRKCGVLRREYVDGCHEALQFYRTGFAPDDVISREFRESYAVADNAPIECLGVWETVGPLGIPVHGVRSFTRLDSQFPDRELTSNVRHAFHAVAIDEHRSAFAPTLWTSVPVIGQSVQQVWFVGAHSDVGGGRAQTGLSDISLDWMIKSARRAGLAFDAGVMYALPLTKDVQQKAFESRKGLQRINPRLDRTMTTTPSEYIHRSVVERYFSENAATYRPTSLRVIEHLLPDLQQKFTNSREDILPLSVPNNIVRNDSMPPSVDVIRSRASG